MNNESVEEIEKQLADLRARWSAHSVPPSMWMELEELEEKLEKAKGTNDAAQRPNSHH